MILNFIVVNLTSIYLLLLYIYICICSLNKRSGSGSGEQLWSGVKQIKQQKLEKYYLFQD